MVAVSHRFEFSQHFRVPARAAFEWCTDYSPKDHAIMGHKGRRASERISPDTILLTDTTYRGGRAVRRKKLIKLDPGRLTYYNIHLTGPNKNSFYLYRILPKGEDESRLDYSGYKVYYFKRKPAAKDVDKMAQADSEAWHVEWENIAKAMERDLRGKR